jgi:hypothetical protein
LVKKSHQQLVQFDLQILPTYISGFSLVKDEERVYPPKYAQDTKKLLEGERNKFQMTLEMGT